MKRTYLFCLLILAAIALALSSLPAAQARGCAKNHRRASCRHRTRHCPRHRRRARRRQAHRHAKNRRNTCVRAHAASRKRGLGGGSGSGLQLFAPNSVWNAPLSANAKLDPSSGVRMAALDSEIGNEVNQGIGPWITATSYSTPFYVVSATQPRVPVKLDGDDGWGDDLQHALDEGVPIPPNAHPADGTDGHLTVYQPSSDSLWEFWRASKQSDGWHARWGGAMRNVSHNPGYYTNDAWPGLSPWQGFNWGSTASSLPVIAGTIRLSDLRAGRIDHALAVALPNTCSGRWSWPAQRSDGSSSDPNCIPEGAHIRLDPSLNLRQMGLPKITLELAQAAQRYGMIVRDVTGHAFQFYGEDPTPQGGDPYDGPNGFFGGLPPWKFLPQFPWAHMQLVKMSWCSQAPCQQSP